MAIKLLLLKSGEDMIADISEMGYGEDDSRRVVGYYLNRPCIIKMRNPNTLEDSSEGRSKKAGYHCFLGCLSLQKTLFLFHPIGL